MRILKLEIEEFGKITDRLFLLGEGLNLIQGPNESGKSTVLAFIRFMLYGFPRKAGADGEEREKRLSWHTGRAAGRLVLRTDAGDYSIFRSVTRQGSAARESFSETLAVTSQSSGEEVFLDGMSPGEYFLGLPAILYDSTLCLRQSDAARISDPTVGEAVSEMLFAGGADMGADAALERLRLARRELQHQKGRGGRIADLADRITAAQDALLRAREDSGALNALRAEVARYRAQVYERRRELEEVSSQLEESSIGETLALFDRAHAARSVCEQKKLNYESLCTKNEAIAHLPRVMAEIQDGLRERESAKQEALQCLPELARMRAVHHDEKMLAAYALTTEKGGAQGVLADFRTAQKKKKRAARLGWIFLAITLVFATVAALIAAGVLTPLLHVLFGTGDYLPGVCVVSIGVTALALLVSLLFFGRAIRFGKRVRAWMKRLGVEQAPMFRTYLEQCANEAQSAEAHRAVLAEIESEYAGRMGRVSRAEARVREALVNAGLNAPEDMEQLSAFLAQCDMHYRGAQEKLLAAKGEWERAHAAWESLCASLEGKDEAQLRARFTVTGAWDPEELRRKRAFLREALVGLEKKCADAERREIALSATAKDPVTGEGELAALRAEHKSATRRHAALELAYTALEEATQSLRGELVPRLCERASAHLRTLTSDAYQRIYTDTDLSVRLDSDKGPLPLSHFSAGCRDAAHLCLRLGLLDVLAKERLPILFDEAFSRLDDERTKGLLQLLTEYCRAGGQCLLFTCHNREAELLFGEEYTHFELR